MTVSFIIPTQGDCAADVEMAHSVASEGDEIIVINGGESAPQEVDLYIEESDDSGTHAINKGILAAKGEYIKTIGNGDINLRDGFLQAIAIMDEHRVDLLQTGGRKQFGMEGEWLCLPEGTNYGTQYGDSLQYGGSGAGAIYRRSVFAKAGLFDPRFQMSDTEFVIRAIISGANVKFARVNAFVKEVDSAIRERERIKQETLYLMAQYGIPPLVPPTLVEDPVWDGGFS